MSLVKTIKFILQHPLNKGKKGSSLWRFASWQVGIRLLRYPILFSFAERSKMIIARSMTGATQNLYCGLHEFYDMAFLLHALRSTDHFFDIGANIGSYTILASSEIGAVTASFEPVPSTFEKLRDNVSLNRTQELVTLHNIGLGGAKKILNFTKDLDTINHVVAQKSSRTIEVEVDVFDNLYSLDTPTIFKIDTEGFETEVLKGMSKALQNKELKAIIIELNGMSSRYGYSDDAIHNKLLDHSFRPYIYDPFARHLTPRMGYGSANTIYIRDIDHVIKRVRDSRTFTINNKTF